MNEVADSAMAGGTPAGDPAARLDGSASPPAPKKKPLWRRIVGALLSLALIVFIFVGVIPQFASYQGAWTAIQAMSPGWWLAILAAAVVNQISFVWPYQAVLPHLRFWHGFMETQTSTAISNTVPAGGAVARTPAATSTKTIRCTSAPAAEPVAIACSASSAPSPVVCR